MSRSVFAPAVDGRPAHPTPRAVAVHEAAHALIALVCGNDATVTMVAADRKSLGSCRTMHRDHLEAALGFLAGPVAESLHEGEDIEVLREVIAHWGDQQDASHDHAQALASIDRYVTMHAPLLDHDELLGLLLGALVLYLCQPHVQRALARIADALLASPTQALDAATVRRLAACNRWRRDPRKHYWDAITEAWNRVQDA